MFTGPVRNPLHRIIDLLTAYHCALGRVHHADTDEARLEALNEWRACNPAVWGGSSSRDDTIRRLADPAKTWLSQINCRHVKAKDFDLVEQCAFILSGFAVSPAPMAMPDVYSRLYTTEEELWREWSKQGTRYLELGSLVARLKELVARAGQMWNPSLRASEAGRGKGQGEGDGATSGRRGEGGGEGDGAGEGRNQGDTPADRPQLFYPLLRQSPGTTFCLLALRLLGMGNVLPLPRSDGFDGDPYLTKADYQRLCNIVCARVPGMTAADWWSYDVQQRIACLEASIGGLAPAEISGVLRVGTGQLMEERLHVEDIDSFRKVRDVHPDVVARFLKDGYLDWSEEDVQVALEAILSVPSHKKDWGGEGNDLYTCNVIVSSSPRPTAFLLKGNGLKSKVMEIKHLGKNGDQVIRLFQSPANLFVIQFVGTIAESVIRHAHGEIARLKTQGQKAQVLIMDGQNTARVLYAYGRLK